MTVAQKKKVKEMYKNVNNRSVELSFRPTGPIKSVAARTPYDEMLREIENEENELSDTNQPA